MALQELSLDQIEVSPTALRDVQQDNPGFNELVDSITVNGVINAIAVRPSTVTPGMFTLVEGTQRYGASKLAGRKTIPAQILSISEFEAWKFQIMGNANRVETKRTDFAKTLQRLLDSDPKMTKAQLAEMNCKSVKWVDDQLQLNKLVSRAKELTDAGRIPASNAIQLAKLPAEDQEALIDSAQTEDTAVFVPMVAQKVKDIKEAKKTGAPRPERKFEATPTMRKLADVQVELDTSTVARQIVTAETDPFDAFRLGIHYCISLDEPTVAKRRAEWEAIEAKNAAEKEARRIEKEKAKAEKDAAAAAKAAS